MSTVDASLLLRLEHGVAEILAGTSHGEGTFGPLLEAIGDALRWPVGAARAVHTSTGPAAPPVLRCVATWHTPRFDGAAFADASRTLTLEPDVGLPGQVWRSQRPAWVRDFSRQRAFPRAEAAARAGLAAAFCFPILSADGVEGILEFFTPEPLEPADDLLSTAISLGRRIGDALRRQRVDEAVRRSEARLRAVLESALDCVVIADADGRVLEFNPAACRTFGYAREDAVGRELAELIVPPALRARHRQGLSRYLRTEVPRALDRHIEITGMRADGTVFPVELTITRIALAGRPVFTGYLRDITERKQAERELRDSRHRVAELAESPQQLWQRYRRRMPQLATCRGEGAAGPTLTTVDG